MDVRQFLLQMILSVITICAFTCGIKAQNLNTTGSVETSSDYAVSTSTMKPVKNTTCEQHNNDCKACVAYSECYYCGSDDKCYRIGFDGTCNMNDAYFKTCKLNFKYLMIIVGSMIAVALLIIIVFCCYCCCKRRGVKLSKDDLKWARQKEERQQIAAEKRKERAERTEEIRRKYGLVKDSNPYQRFDA